MLSIDFLPQAHEEEILALLLEKRKAFPALADTELLFGIVNNQIGRAIVKRADGDLRKAAKLVKAFTLTVSGSLGFDYAQVTKGGIPVSETDAFLQSRFVRGLYFAGEILDVDGQCGGFNLQWAFSSAMRVKKALESK
jgi:predicted flavoprotein YhiN